MDTYRRKKFGENAALASGSVHSEVQN